jgi:hypothetical protein
MLLNEREQALRLSLMRMERREEAVKTDEVLRINFRGGSNRTDDFCRRFCAKRRKQQSASERGSEDQGDPEASAEQQQ